jgi:hypothetical protein
MIRSSEADLPGIHSSSIATNAKVGEEVMGKTLLLAGTRFRPTPKLFTIRPESCSRCAGISVHVGLENLFTMSRHIQQSDLPGVVGDA